MVSMQAFYTNLFSSTTENGTFAGLLRVAQASLKDILVVRSELAWEVWD